MAEKRYGIKPAINSSTVGSATATGEARGPKDVGSALAQDKATDTYQSGKPSGGDSNPAPSGDY